VLPLVGLTAAVVVEHRNLKIACGTLLHACLWKHERLRRVELPVLLATYFVYRLARPMPLPRDT
jgi:hypothetical protein